MNWLDWAIISFLCWGAVNGFQRGWRSFLTGFVALVVGSFISLGLRPVMTVYINDIWHVSAKVREIISPFIYLPVGTATLDDASVLSYMGMPEQMIAPVMAADGEGIAGRIASIFVMSLALCLGVLLFYYTFKTSLEIVTRGLPARGGSKTGLLGRLFGLVCGLAQVPIFLAVLLGLFIPFIPLWPFFEGSYLLQPILDLSFFWFF